MQPLKVGIREFRTHLPHYLLETGRPVAVTRHGETIGYFIPTRETKKADDLAALKTAAAQLDALLAAEGLSEDELVAEFRRLRGRQMG
jgi:antitoxin (DNA-binding transcriptional repressor) of toxin-antitoxin stability system